MRALAGGRQASEQFERALQVADRFARCATPACQLAGELVVARGAPRVAGEVEVVGQLGRFALGAGPRFEMPADALVQLGAPLRAQAGIQLFAVQRVPKREAGAVVRIGDAVDEALAVGQIEADAFDIGSRVVGRARRHHD